MPSGWAQKIWMELQTGRKSIHCKTMAMMLQLETLMVMDMMTLLSLRRLKRVHGPMMTIEDMYLSMAEIPEWSLMMIPLRHKL